MKTELLSVAALMIALFSWFMPAGGCFIGPTAVLLGVIGLMRINQNPTVYKGQIVAIAGILMGFASTVYVHVAWAKFMHVISGGR